MFAPSGGGVCSSGCVCSEGVSAPGSVSALGVSAPRGCTPPWTEFLTHACENITFPQLRLGAVITQEKCPQTLE